MNLRRLAVLGLAALLLNTVGCKTDEQGADAANPITPVISASATSVSAVPTSSVTITVSAGRAPVTLSTTLGTFSNATRTISLGAVPGTAVLTPCDARVTPSCAGTAVVSASTSDFASNSVTVVFTGFEDCGNGVDDNGDGIVDCQDPQCPLNQPCSTTNLVCSSTQECNKCLPPAGVTVEPSREVTCNDGDDNDCDGAADCNDSDCNDAACLISAGAFGVCEGGACVCNQTEQAEATCGDGKDNDCDQLADCNDPDCVGKSCNAAGMQCTGLTPSTCAYCPTGATETAAQCGDGKDNDCDGKADCYDTGCQPSAVGGTDGQQCNPFGGACMLTMGVPSCGCTTGATSETSCFGGVDDDCDGRVDCADTDCQPVASGLLGPSCGPNGVTCTSAGSCACPGGEVELCDNYDVGGNAVDDNCDGRANCQDYSCRPVAAGQLGEDCSGVGEFGKACTPGGTCSCTGNGGTAEVAETTCDDGIDNDCDFLVDCEDPSCGTPTRRTCGPGGATCSVATPGLCECVGAVAETGAFCADGLDNNCNGLKDCEEPGCASVACSGTLPTYVCITGACSDPATQYAVKVTPARPRIPSDGVATTSVEIEVTQNGQPKPGLTLTVALQGTARGTLTLPPAPITTDAQGKVTIGFQSNGVSGVQTILATVQGIGAQGTGTVALPAIGEIRILENGGVLYDVMGVKNSGFQEQNQLVVEILDTEQGAYPDGLAVTFEHQQLGGSTLEAPSPCMTSPPPGVPIPSCVTTAVATDANGLARVRLYSGTVAGVVGVTAKATAGGILRFFQLPSVAVVGAKPNAGHFSMVCGTVNVPAYAGYDCHVSLIDAPFTCAAFLKDRYNNLLGRATTVSFLSEAGAVGQPAVTPAYDPANDPVSQADLGTAVEIINTLGAKLPKDVTPLPDGPDADLLADEVSVQVAPDACGVSSRNPRDGVATVVAWTPGEEAYYDANGNGTYDAGEPFVDLPEPFVDYDDDDTRDGDEPFIDTNGNGSWTDVNGVWDADTNIWTKTLVVYTGMPAFLRSNATGTDADYLSRWIDPADWGTFSRPTPLASFDVSPMFQPDPYYDCNTNGRYDTAALERFTDLPPENGTYEVGEPIIDCNGNGLYDPPPLTVPEAYTDVNGDGVYTPVVTPATADTLIVTASDRNLNRLSAETKYAVTIPDGVGFTAEYLGEATIPDRRGFAFGYQPCNSATPTSCALDCADVAPPGGHCVMRTRVSEFSYGYAHYVNFRGGEADTADGATEAFWEMELFGEILKISVPGTHE